MNLSLQQKEILKFGLMISTIFTAGVTFLYKLFSRRRPAINKKRRRQIIGSSLFFRHKKIEKMTLKTIASTDASIIKLEDKLDKMNNFLDKSHEKFTDEKLEKQDQFFFKMLKNFSKVCQAKSVKAHNKSKNGNKYQTLEENKIMIQN